MSRSPGYHTFEGALTGGVPKAVWLPLFFFFPFLFLGEGEGWGFYNEDSSIWGRISGVPHFAKCTCELEVWGSKLLLTFPGVAASGLVYGLVVQLLAVNV